MKFIHTADLHIGLKQSSEYSENVRRRLEEDNLIILSKIINYANEKNIKYIFIAGDLFDYPDISDDIFEFVLTEFEKYDGEIFISPGNHDCLNEQSIYNNIILDNVYVFGNEITFFEKKDAYIYGFGFSASHKSDDTFNGFKTKAKDKPVIFITHTDLQNDSFYNPVKLSDIAESGISYFAAGHIHLAGDIKKAGDTTVAFSGAPQNLSFKETWETGINIIDISDGIVSVSKKDISCHKFRYFDIDISEASSSDDILRLCKKTVIGNDPENTLFQINLTGKCSDNITVDISKLTGELSETCLFIKMKANYTLKYNIDVISKEESVRGEYVRSVLKNNSDESDEFISRVIERGLRYL